MYVPSVYSILTVMCLWCDGPKQQFHGLLAPAGMCRAHGIAHQRVTERQGLGGALRAAWALNKHSVVEVIVGRDCNVEHHRNIQEQVKAAVLRALRTLAPHTQGTSSSGAFC